MKNKIQQYIILFLLVIGVITTITTGYAHPGSPLEEGQEIPILMYHHLTLQGENLNSVTVSVEKFKRDMEYLKEEGYTTLFFSDILEAQAEGRPLPSKPIIITFDDGYRSNYEYAYPILKEKGLKGTIFLIGWSMGRTTHKDGITPIIPHFNWDEAREMYNSGVIDLQHHTYDLHNSTMLIPSYGIGVMPYYNETMEDYTNRFLYDTILWKQKIEAEVGNHVFVFSYPYGLANPLTEQILKDSGFYFSVLTGTGIKMWSNTRFSLYRMNVTEEDTLETLLQQFTYYTN
ncbi:MAG: polysaccharide deacetylase family protein [Epulopiscium sp.]|nr:polysaccharide deacetylase family protein [Candidatus Epulonipiscium sp.]